VKHKPVLTYSGTGSRSVKAVQREPERKTMKERISKTDTFLSLSKRPRTARWWKQRWGLWWCDAWRM